MSCVRWAQEAYIGRLGNEDVLASFIECANRTELTSCEFDSVSSRGILLSLKVDSGLLIVGFDIIGRLKTFIVDVLDLGHSGHVYEREQSQ